MNFALMLLLKILAFFVSITLLISAVIFALIGMVARVPGNLIVLMSNFCFIYGNRIALWLLPKIKEVKK